MQTLVSVVILALVASSCLKRRQVTDKPPAAKEACRAGTKPYRDTKGELLCIIENNKPAIIQTTTPPNPHSRCTNLQVLHIDGYCALRSGVTCPEGTEKKVVHNEEKCVAIEDKESTKEKDGEDETTEENGGDTVSQEEEQPLLVGITTETKLNTIKVNASCIGNKCIHPHAEKLVCQVRCSAGRGGINMNKIIEIKKNGNNKLANKLCTYDEIVLGGEKHIECYLITSGWWITGWGSKESKKKEDSACIGDGQEDMCPFLGLTPKTVGKKYICVESLNTDSDPKSSTDKDYLAIHNKKCDTIKNDNPKLQIEFSL